MGISHLKAVRRTTDDGVFPLAWMAARSRQADFQISSSITDSGHELTLQRPTSAEPAVSR